MSVGEYIVPVVICVVVVFGAFQKVDLFGSFIDGAKEGIDSLIKMAPSLIALIIGVNMLEASGFFQIVSDWLSPVCGMMGIPPEVVPLGLMRPVTGSGSFAMLNSIYEQYGADSMIGKAASIMAGSTETTFYAIAVYYGAAGIKKTRYTIPAALTADMAGMFLSAWIVRFFG